MGRSFLFLVALATTIVSCRHADIKPYHSTASVFRQVWHISSEMQAVDCLSTPDASVKLAVIASVDGRTERKGTQYLLLAPLVSDFGSSTNFSNIMVNQAAVVQRQQIPTLIAGLKQCIDRWDADVPSYKAEFWEFISAPDGQQDVGQDSVTSSHVFLRVAYNLTSNGSNITVYLTERDYQYVWLTDKKEAAKCFLEKIEVANALLTEK